MKFALFTAALFLTACGYESRSNELAGQVKKVMHNTPLICPDFFDVDVSLGVMRNGVGSMSSQDLWLVVDDRALQDIFKQAAETGSLVKVTYDTRRVSFCQPNRIVRTAQIIP